jgi:uncharacterized lipoprotein YajG
MTTRFISLISLIICIFFLAACQPNLEASEVTPHLALMATVLATDMAAPTASWRQ